MTVDVFYSPPLLMILGAALLGIVPASLRAPWCILVPLAGLGSLWQTPGEADRLAMVFGTIFLLIAAIGGIYAFHLKDRLQQISALIYGGGALGVVLAKDYYTLFIYWELMAVSSTYLVWAAGTPQSRNAGMRYLAAHIFGGGLLFAGILMQIHETGSSAIASLPAVYSASSVLILLGIALNTAIPPLNAWLPDAYPRATITGAVFMSAFTTKSAVYMLMRVFPGWEILIWAGVGMALYGVVYAVLANDIREILAYHIISQVGYMVAGVGIGTELALNGAAAHAFSHILYKSLLFMGAGAVLYATGKSKLTELGGISGRMRAVVALYMIGAFSISGFPLFNGFISKSIIVSAAGESHLDWAMLLLILASVGTFLHTGLKLPYFTWFGESKSEITVRPVPRNMIAAMGAGAFLCFLFGVWPDLLYRHLPYPISYEPYTVYHLVEATQILTFTMIGFWILRKKLKGEPKIALDTDWFYRRPAKLARAVFVSGFASIFDAAERGVGGAAARLSAAFDRSGDAPPAVRPGMFQLMGAVLALCVALGLLLILRTT